MLNENEKVYLFRCKNLADLKKHLKTNLQGNFSFLFPKDKGSSILVKPNLNSNMNALTGNTTDLRLLASIIEFLKDWGYTKITVGEGNNSGFFRAGINVISRLKVDKLAEYYGVKIVDFNYSDSEEIELENGIKANVAKECLGADFFINVPKLKTHYETEMSVCLKSLIGCLVGRENKKKVHCSLIRNILKLNEAIEPDLHIVDGLIAMEGTGPSLGEPKKIDTVLIGTDPYLIDMVASKVAGYSDFKEIPVLNEALKQGKIDERMIKEYKKIQVEAYYFKRPKVSFLVKLTINPRIQKHLIKIRYAPLIKKIFNWAFVRKILFALKISQDYIVFKELEISLPYLQNGMCGDQCHACGDICPLDFKLPQDFGSERIKSCIKCLYCYSICPEKNIQVNGDLGFFKQQLKEYDTQIRNLFIGTQ